MDRKHGIGRLTVVGIATALAVACGDEPTAKPTGLAMGGHIAASDATAEGPDGSNRPPLIEKISFSPRSPAPGDRLNSSVTASDPDGDKLELIYRWRVDGRPVPGSRPDIRLSDARKGSQIELTVTARDGKLESPPFARTIEVSNQPPVVVSAEFEPASAITVAQDIGVRPNAMDSDGDPLTFRTSWRVNGAVVAIDEPVLSKTKFRRGDKISFELVALDGVSESRPFVSPTIKVENAPPHIDSFPKGFGVDGSLRYAIEASDPDRDMRLRYRLIQGPKGMVMDNFEGVLTWLPARDQIGKHPVEIEVDDLRGGIWRQTFDLEVDFGAPPASVGR